MPVVFVGGIHGAGKSALCNTLATRVVAKHLTAGTVISAAKSEIAPTKAVSDLSRNQDLLLQGLARYEGERVILDGHFALITNDGIQTIPLPTFASLSPLGFLLVDVDPVVAQRRLEARDGKHYSLALLTELRDAESEHADIVASELDLPFVTVRSDDVSRALEFFTSLSWGVD